jgi:hypothetical protein
LRLKTNENRHLLWCGMKHLHMYALSLKKYFTIYYLNVCNWNKQKTRMNEVIWMVCFIYNIFFFAQY